MANFGNRLNSRINSGLSSQIVIKVNETTVGAIQKLSIIQMREMSVWEEIGTDGIVEIHPKGSSKIDLGVSRIVFDNLRITEAFGRGFVNLQSQRFPFDIHIIDKSFSTSESVVNTRKEENRDLNGFSWERTVLSAITGRNLVSATPRTTFYPGSKTRNESDINIKYNRNSIVHSFHNCWFKKISTTYGVENFTVVDDADLVCEFVTTMQDGKDSSNGGINFIKYDFDTMERATDLKAIRGAVQKMPFWKYWKI